MDLLFLGFESEPSQLLGVETARLTGVIGQVSDEGAPRPELTNHVYRSRNSRVASIEGAVEVEDVGRVGLQEPRVASSRGSPPPWKEIPVRRTQGGLSRRPKRSRRTPVPSPRTAKTPLGTPSRR